ncbi:MAG: DNA pilot protein [Arizlama microvirus]|nr:MAG: DNA pilot protein [Arizlama microvirus]
MKNKGKTMFDIGGLLGGLAQGVAGIWETNQNVEMQKKNNAMQMNLANTAVQRRAADMQAAGINPLMAAGGQPAQTPTLQAPQMRGMADSIGAAAKPFTTAAQTALQQQAMDVQKTEAETKRIEAEERKATAEAALSRTTESWYGPQARSHMNVQDATAREANARTLTTEALREPTVQKLLQETAASVQQTKTEKERTTEHAAIAREASKLYGARANEAATIAAQAATYYKNFFSHEKQQGLDKTDLQMELLRSENFQKIIQNILDNEYGKMERWTNIMNNPMKAGAALAAANAKGSGSVTNKPVPGR